MLFSADPMEKSDVMCFIPASFPFSGTFEEKEARRKRIIKRDINKVKEASRRKKENNENKRISKKKNEEKVNNE